MPGGSLLGTGGSLLGATGGAGEVLGGQPRVDGEVVRMTVQRYIFHCTTLRARPPASCRGLPVRGRGYAKQARRGAGEVPGVRHPQGSPDVHQVSRNR